VSHPARTVLGALGALALLAAACGANPAASVVRSLTSVFDSPVDCGPITNLEICHVAVEVAATAKTNPLPIGKVSIRSPTSADACATGFHACGPSDVIVTIESGDTLQDIPLVPTAGGGWVRLDLVR
jgi:hypothetical protein